MTDEEQLELEIKELREELKEFDYVNKNDFTIGMIIISFQLIGLLGFGILFIYLTLKPYL